MGRNNNQNNKMKMRKIFFDCEFTGLHQNTTLISIGFVSECNKTFYAEFTDYDKNQLDDWLQENVINNLTMSDEKHGYKDTMTKNWKLKGDSSFIKHYLTLWLAQFDEIEIWSDCLSYDWVLFCELFGGAMNIPEHVYYIPYDICTSFKEKGIDPDINREEFAFDSNVNNQKHNSLWDAQVIRYCYFKLRLK